MAELRQEKEREEGSRAWALGLTGATASYDQAPMNPSTRGRSVADGKNEDEEEERGQSGAKRRGRVEGS